MTSYIEIIGLGSGTIDQLSYGIYKKMIQAEGVVYTRTKDHPVVGALEKEGVRFQSFDHVYEKHEQFASVYTEIVDTLVREAKKHTVVYTVPGHPMVAEKTVELLLEQTEVPVRIGGGSSFIDDVYTALQIDPIEGFQLLDATAFDRSELTYKQHMVFCQVYDQMVASEVKLALLEDLPPSFEVTVVDAAGTPKEEIVQLPLEALDRQVEQSNLMIVYVPPVKEDMLHHQFSTLRKVIETLRGPEGCPWDRKQTHESLRRYALEEVYELFAAIQAEDDDGMIEELGDVLLQVMLHSQIGTDAGYFTIEDVIQSITDKMIRRHPHVFGEETYSSEQEMRKRWEEIKQKEQGTNMTHKEFFASIPTNAPALMRSETIQTKSVEAGFAWEHVQDIWDKLSEEIMEVQEAIEAGDQDGIEDELGDVLFVLVNIARYYDIHPELALHRANEKFMSRFSHVEQKLRANEKCITDASDEELDMLWKEAKERVKAHENR